jgi:hypothetical protein
MVFTSEMDKEFNLGYMIPQEHAMVRDRADCYSYKSRYIGVVFNCNNVSDA